MAKNKTKSAAETKSQPFFLGQRLRLKIDRLASHSGYGVAREQGFVVFVPLSAPGDVVEAEIVALHKTYAEARLLKIQAPSPFRRTPPCPWFGRCGGCHWQHVEYGEQVQQKQNILKQSLQKHLALDAQEWRPFVPAANEFRYRNRIQVHKKGSQVGYFAAGTNDLVPITDCLLAEERIVAQLPATEKLPQDGRIEIARTQNEKIEIRSSSETAEAHLFAQVNEQQNHTLIRLLLENVRIEPKEVLDLYCGSGNFTLALAERFPQASVEGVELSSRMIQLAKAQHMQRAVRWTAQSTSQFLSKWSPKADPLLVVLDPPRPGCDAETREQILRIKPRQILYVSCNPATLARDLETWLKSGYYRIDLAQGLDMFPQTAHLEALVSLIARAP